MGIADIELHHFAFDPDELILDIGSGERMVGVGRNTNVNIAMVMRAINLDFIL